MPFGISRALKKPHFRAHAGMSHNLLGQQPSLDLSVLSGLPERHNGTTTICIKIYGWSEPLPKGQ